MNTATVLVILMWMLIVAAFAFTIGWAFNAESNRRRVAHSRISDQLWRIGRDTDSHERHLNEVLKILSEIRTQVLDVSKGLEKTIR